MAVNVYARHRIIDKSPKFFLLTGMQHRMAAIIVARIEILRPTAARSHKSRDRG
jgi:hypothetical protein